MKMLEELPIKSGGVVEAADQFDWQPLMEVSNDRLSTTEGSGTLNRIGDYADHLD